MKFSKLLLLPAFALLSLTGFSQEKGGKKDTTQHVALYTCPMHNTVAMKKPGNCPICGMKLQRSAKEQMKTEVTKNYSCPIHLDVQSDKPGKCSKCGMNLTLSSKEKMKTEVMNNYTCAMHSDVKSAKPGKCPYCGMNLREVKKNATPENE
jgi:transcription initiation factor IIE alpha subunit